MGLSLHKGAGLAGMAGLLLGGTLYGQSMTFAVLSDPQSFAVARGGSDVDRDQIRFQTQYSLDRAVAELNQLVHTGTRIDVLVIVGGFGLKTTDQASLPQAVSERLGILRAALVPAVYVLPGDDDVDAGSNDRLTRYEEFVLQLRKSLPGKDVRSLTTETPNISG